jgi:hypothetical protein
MKDLKLYPCPIRRRYVLLEPWSFVCKGTTFTIDAGFEYDGASIPKGAWYSTYSPYNPIVMLAALEHDYLCIHRPLGISSADAALHFKKALTYANPIKRELMYRAVLWFGPMWGG